MFPSQRYPTADPAADRDVKRRIMAVLFSDDIPDPRDAAIVGLADTTGLLRSLLSDVKWITSHPVSCRCASWT